MPVAFSPVSLMPPVPLRFGVWRPLLGIVQGAVSKVAAETSGWRVEWHFRRDGAFSCARRAPLYAALLLMSLALPLGFWLLGTAKALWIACADVLVGWSLIRLGLRRAGDCEHIALQPRLLQVQRRSGGRTQCVQFNPRWVRIEPDRDDGSLVRLSGQGQSIVVGEFVLPRYRRQLADELRRALRHLDHQVQPRRETQ